MALTSCGKLLAKATLELKRCKIASANLDARVLLEHILDKDALFLAQNLSRPVTNAEYSRFRRAIRRRKAGEPVAYITGHKEFYGYDFLVNKNVLVPRPETEWLVEKSMAFLKDYLKCHSSVAMATEESSKQSERAATLRSFANAQDDRAVNILDLGTGSGCIVISIIKELEKTEIEDSRFRFYASDNSKRAIGVARKNAKLHKVGQKIKFLHSDLFENRLISKKFNLILANLPYVPLSPGSAANLKNPDILATTFEPHSAIYASSNGTSIVRRFLKEAPGKVDGRFLIIMEVDPRNCEQISSIASQSFPQANITTKRDLAGKNRYVLISSK